MCSPRCSSIVEFNEIIVIKWSIDDIPRANWLQIGRSSFPIEPLSRWLDNVRIYNNSRTYHESVFRLLSLLIVWLRLKIILYFLDIFWIFLWYFIKTEVHKVYEKRKSKKNKIFCKHTRNVYSIRCVSMRSRCIFYLVQLKQNCKNYKIGEIREIETILRIVKMLNLIKNVLKNYMSRLR